MLTYTHPTATNASRLFCKSILFAPSIKKTIPKPQSQNKNSKLSIHLSSKTEMVHTKKKKKRTLAHCRLHCLCINQIFVLSFQFALLFFLGKFCHHTASNRTCARHIREGSSVSEFVQTDRHISDQQQRKASTQPRGQKRNPFGTKLFLSCSLFSLFPPPPPAHTSIFRKKYQNVKLGF